MRAHLRDALHGGSRGRRRRGAGRDAIQRHAVSASRRRHRWQAMTSASLGGGGGLIFAVGGLIAIVALVLMCGSGGVRPLSKRSRRDGVSLSGQTTHRSLNPLSRDLTRGSMRSITVTPMIATVMASAARCRPIGVNLSDVHRSPCRSWPAADPRLPLPLATATAGAARPARPHLLRERSSGRRPSRGVLSDVIAGTTNTAASSVHGQRSAPRCHGRRAGHAAGHPPYALAATNAQFRASGFTRGVLSDGIAGAGADSPTDPLCTPKDAIRI